MQHSIAAKYAARPAARFVRPSARVRERRLGLRVNGSFQPASARATVLQRNDLPPLVPLRADWRAEPTEQTALREVAEETGLEVHITAPFDSIHYTFVQRGTRIHKTVHYFLMEPVGGDLAGHDQEFEDVAWVAMDDASGLLTFET